MQFHNWHSLNASSLADSEDDSSPDQGSFMNDSTGVPAFSGVTAQEYVMNDAGEVSPVYGATTHSATTSSATAAATGAPPAPTLVGSSNGLQFELIWDSSVANAPRGFTQAIVDAAKFYTTLFSNQALIAIDVGYGEIAGSPMAPSALGESESLGYLTDYPTVTSVLTGDGFSFSASNEPTASQFFITSADAKAQGLVNPIAGLDGFIGFSNLSGTGFSWNTAASPIGLNAGTKANQFDLQAAAAHEISEVMGRLGLEGDAIINGQPTYAPLDLFNYQSNGVLELSANGGYFSVNDGRTNLGNFNDAAVNGGDIGDWALQSNTLGLIRGFEDAYSAFALPGVNGQVSLSDIIEDAALGYNLAPAASVALLGNYAAAGFADAASLHGTADAQDGQAPQQQTLLGLPHG
jgi:hypothetical protein